MPDIKQRLTSQRVNARSWNPVAPRGGPRPISLPSIRATISNLRDFCHRRSSDRPAVAHDGDSIADLVQFVETVANVDDADAVGFEPADDLEQRFRPRARSSDDVGSSMMTSRRRLETARAIATICCRATLNCSTVAHVDVIAESSRTVAGVAVHLPPVKKTPTPRLAAHEDVLGHRAKRDEIDLLVDRADAPALRLLRVRRNRPAPSSMIVPPSRR